MTSTPMLSTPNRRRRLALAGFGLTAGLGPLSWRGARASTLPSTSATLPTLRLAGTASGTGGLALLGTAYQRAHPGLAIDLLPAMGNAGGIRALIDGRADIAVSHRMPTLAERARAPLVAMPYARTPFVLAVQHALGIERIGIDELAALYGQPAPTFANGRRARPVLHLADALDTDLLRSMSPAVARALDDAAARCGTLDATTDAECADLIERTPGAFGPSTLALIDSELRPLRALVIDDFPPPTPEHVTSGRYPWSKPMLLVHAGDPPPAVEAFVDFVCSSGARRLLAMAGHCTS